VRELGFVPHISSRGEEAAGKRRDPGYRPRRWVVERSNSWLNRYRGLLVRWSKKPENHLALLQLGCGVIAWRQAEVAALAR
jgi:putative transposase